MKKMRLERFIFQDGYKSFLLHLFNLNATRDLKGIRDKAMLEFAYATGMKVTEIISLDLEDINLEEDYFKGGLKTDAGKNRIVPIHPIIKDLVTNRYNKDNIALFNDEYGQQGTIMTYDKYRGRFNKVMEKLKMEHRPHDARHTFATKAKLYGVDEYVIKLLMGHAINDVTEEIYTHRTIENLRNELLKIKK